MISVIGPMLVGTLSKRRLESGPGQTITCLTKCHQSEWQYATAVVAAGRKNSRSGNAC